MRQYRSTLLIAGALAGGTLWLFWPLVNYGYVMFDDWDYVAHNPEVQAGLRWSGLKWAFTTFHASNWHPLTWLSHMADVQFLGTNPGRYHLTNVLLHAANSVLLFFALRGITGTVWRSGFV